jgi:hypothetical protein
MNCVRLSEPVSPNNLFCTYCCTQNSLTTCISQPWNKHLSNEPLRGEGSLEEMMMLIIPSYFRAAQCRLSQSVCNNPDRIAVSFTERFLERSQREDANMRILVSPRLFVYPPITKELLNGFLRNLILVLGFVNRLQFWFKLDNNNGHFRQDLHEFLWAFWT